MSILRQGNRINEFDYGHTSIVTLTRGWRKARSVWCQCNIPIVQKLADTLGAELAPSRPICGSDANAPIFEVADYGIVGDLFQVVRRWWRKLRR